MVIIVIIIITMIIIIIIIIIIQKIIGYPSQTPRVLRKLLPSSID